MTHVDNGWVSRRTLLAGGVASIVGLAGLGVATDYEANRHPSLHRRLFGCGHTPSLPASSYRVTTGTTRSAAMKGDMPWTVALPADHSPGQPLPVVLCLPGDGGRNETLTGSVGLPSWATAAGLRLGFACPGGEGSTYYHPRSDGTDSFTWVTEEFLPMAEQRFGFGGSKPARAVFGWSMGGYGALLVALRRPDLVSAAVGSSPAVFPTYAAAITGHAGTFDSASDWARWGFWDQAGQVHDVAVRLDCGTGDPFVATTRSLLHRIPGAVGTIADGCHDNGFWRRTATSQLHFVASHLTA
jgi:S-formylglutathione hydrolase FrmB